jgi:hypothetical protein
MVVVAVVVVTVVEVSVAAAAVVVVVEVVVEAVVVARCSCEYNQHCDYGNRQEEEEEQRGLRRGDSAKPAHAPGSLTPRASSSPSWIGMRRNGGVKSMTRGSAAPMGWYSRTCADDNACATRMRMCTHDDSECEKGAPKRFHTWSRQCKDVMTVTMTTRPPRIIKAWWWGTDARSNGQQVVVRRKEVLTRKAINNVWMEEMVLTHVATNSMWWW